MPHSSSDQPKLMWLGTHVDLLENQCNQTVLGGVIQAGLEKGSSARRLLSVLHCRRQACEGCTRRRLVVTVCREGSESRDFDPKNRQVGNW